MAENYTKPRYPNDIEIYDGNPVFVSGSGMTPFGFYDHDEVFQGDAPKVARFVASRLGYPVMDVELQSGSMFACFEEAVTTYGNQVYAYKVRENYLSLEGSTRDVDANSMVVEPTLQRIVEIAKNYGTEADVGGNIELHHDLLEVKAGVQEYDLDVWAKSKGIEGGIEIRKIFYEAPPAILRYFDPYAGTGTGIQSLMDAFDFGSYSPGVNFLLMPVSFDILKVQAIEFNDQVRRSAYSFRISNNKLQIFPIPPKDGVLRIEYYKLSDKRKLNANAGTYASTATKPVKFKATVPEGETSVAIQIKHNIGTDEDFDAATVQLYDQELDGQDIANYPVMFIPGSIKKVDDDTIEVTVLQDVPNGLAIFTYNPLSTTVTGTSYLDKGSYSVSFEVKIPEGQTSYTQRFIHSLNTSNLAVQVYEESNDRSMVIPADVRIVSDYEVDITFTKDITGHVLFMGKAMESSMDSGVITNVSEVPYQNPTYSKINSIGRQWIFRYTLALCKEVLAYIRGKYTTVPIPDSEATLNQQDLLTDARQEKKDLAEELDKLLETSSRSSQLELKAKEADNLRAVLAGVPVGIFIG